RESRPFQFPEEEESLLGLPCQKRGLPEIIYIVMIYIFLSLVSSKPSLILEPNWSQIYRGEKVTLTCEIQDDGGTQWTYEWRTTNGRPITSSEHKTITATELDSGEYSCRGIRDYKLTEWSDSVRLTVKRDLVLQPNWSQIYSGEKVTLRCEIQDDGGTQWTYEWIPINGKTPTPSEHKTITATELDSGEYSCRGFRDYKLTEWSDSVRLTVKRSKDELSSYTIIPAGGSVTLTCSVDGSTGWKFDWFRNGQQYPADGSSRNTEPDGTIRVSEGGKYSCRGGRGDPVSESGTSYKFTDGSFILLDNKHTLPWILTVIFAFVSCVT
uniref:Ig-like domain-containing protein n=1 Tax=Poecilia mexicana TaxID=48701 RepID=A0A3B3XFL6_9TELE